MTRIPRKLVIGIAAFVAAFAIAVPVYAALNAGTPPAPTVDVVLEPNASAPTAAQIAAISGPAPAREDVAPSAPVDPAAPTANVNIAP